MHSSDPPSLLKHLIQEDPGASFTNYIFYKSMCGSVASRATMTWILSSFCNNLEFWRPLEFITLESLFDSKIKPVSPKGNQLWILIGRADAEAEAPILWPLDAKSQLTRKDPDAGKNLGQEEKGMTEDEIVGWHHQLNGHEFEQTMGDSEGQGSLVNCSPWGRKESDMTWRLNNRVHKSLCFVLQLPMS